MKFKVNFRVVAWVLLTLALVALASPYSGIGFYQDPSQVKVTLRAVNEGEERQPDLVFARTNLPFGYPTNGAKLPVVLESASTLRIYLNPDAPVARDLPAWFNYVFDSADPNSPPVPHLMFPSYTVSFGYAGTAISYVYDSQTDSLLFHYASAVNNRPKNTD